MSGLAIFFLILQFPSLCIAFSSVLLLWRYPVLTLSFPRSHVQELGSASPTPTQGEVTCQLSHRELISSVSFPLASLLRTLLPDATHALLGGMIGA